jgi:peptide deformylase
MINILPVAQQGEPILAIQASLVAETEFGTAWLKQLAESMQNTMLARQGVGIAAPQMYVSKRMIIVASRPNPRYPDAPDMPAVVMVNPEILTASKQQVAGEEGCLSVANTRGQVARAESVLVRYFTLDGEMKEIEYSGFPARIVQHEIDHLDGILFVDRLT